MPPGAFWMKTAPVEVAKRFKELKKEAPAHAV